MNDNSLAAQINDLLDIVIDLKFEIATNESATKRIVQELEFLHRVLKINDIDINLYREDNNDDN